MSMFTFYFWSHLWRYDSDNMLWLVYLFLCVCVFVSPVAYFYYTTPNVGVLYIYDNNTGKYQEFVAVVLLRKRRTFTMFIGRGTCNDIPHLYYAISVTIATKLYQKHITRLLPLALYTGHILMCFLAVTSPPSLHTHRYGTAMTNHHRNGTY